MARVSGDPRSGLAKRDVTICRDSVTPFVGSFLMSTAPVRDVPAACGTRANEVLRVTGPS